MKTGVIGHLAENVARLLRLSAGSRVIRRSQADDDDTQSAREYELSFWRAASSVWY